MPTSSSLGDNRTVRPTRPAQDVVIAISPSSTTPPCATLLSIATCILLIASAATVGVWAAMAR